MPRVVAVLDLDLPEFRGWINGNIAPGFEPRFLSASASELWQVLPEAEFVVVAEAPVTAEMMAAAPRLKLIQLVQVGYDNVDVAAARRAGVPVANTAGLNATSVAEHALMLTLATLRRLVACDTAVRRLEWPQFEMFRRGIHDFSGATLGIIGLGAIGKALATLSRPMAGRILYYQRHPLSPADEQRLGVIYAPFPDLLRQSDVVSLHLPLTAETRGLIGRAELALMKPAAVLINTARGAIIDQDALVECLRGGKLMGVGLDVLWDEPLPAGSPLSTFDNVIFTPHLAAASQELTWKLFRFGFENIYRVAAGEQPLNAVVSPQALKSASGKEVHSP